MKLFITIFILVLFLGINTAKADYITTHTFVVDSDTTITIVVSGTLNASMDGDTGTLSNALNLNFNIKSNEDSETIRMHALVLDSASTKENAFYCTDTSEGTRRSLHLVLGDCATGHEPDSSSIADCQQEKSTAVNNSDAIAYPGTLSITNDGRVQYNSSRGYFTCKVKSGVTDLTLALTTTPKAGTFDSASAMDEPDKYEAEIYLDNIPGV